MSAALKDPPEVRCQQCLDTRFVSTPRLGRVRCPYCRPAKVTRVSPHKMRELLSAVEARKREQDAMSAAIVPENFKFPDIPNHLLTTQRVLERWGDDGSGLPSETPDAYRVARAPPLDPATYVEVERLINNSATRVRRFVYDWYRSSNPVYITSERRKMSRRQVGRMRIDVLHVMKARFLRSAHGDLVALIRFIPE